MATAMFYTTVMVFLEIDDEPTDLMRYSWDLAERYDADLIAFAAVEPRLFGIDGSVLPSDVMSRQVEEIEIRLKVFEEAFRAMTGHSNRASWRCLLGNPTSFLALHSRAADLVIVGGASNGRKSRQLIDVGSLVLTCGRPVLLTSSKRDPIKADHILVAWKDTREARRAVEDAMPFLTQAREVLLATIAPNDRITARESAADVVKFLMKHGVKARSRIEEADDDGKGLATLARAIEADLIVSGGYGHSRFHEQVFGGATRSLLKANAFNRLLSN
jgi:nucleotide-binding universal stress UspA family protein